MRQSDILRERLVRNELAVSALTGGKKGVIAVDITAAGSGYSSAPTVTIEAPTSGTQATAVAYLTGGGVSRVIVTNPGDGYDPGDVPTVTFGSGSAAAVARVGPVALDAIPTTLLPVGVMVSVYLSGQLSFYRLCLGTDAESSPTVIRPDDYAASTNEKVWKLISAGSGSGPLCKYDATADPTVNDDSGDGYSVGSRWVNVTTDKEFVCCESTTGSAVWVETTSGGSSGPLNKLNATANPTTGDDTGDGYSVGSIWVNVTDDKVFICVDATSSAAVWKRLSWTVGGATDNILVPSQVYLISGLLELSVTAEMGFSFSYDGSPVGSLYYLDSVFHMEGGSASLTLDYAYVFIDSGVNIGTDTNPGAGNLTVLNAIAAGGNKFNVSSAGNITKINNVACSFPSSQGAAGTYLKNDGSGNFSWDTPSGGSSSGPDHAEIWAFA